MLHVLLLILKIIGWILLGIIGLLLLLVLLILFCPIRYQADISYQGGKTLRAKAKMRYLIVSVRVLYDQSREKDKLEQEIRVLWFRLGKKKAEAAEHEAEHLADEGFDDAWDDSDMDEYEDEICEDPVQSQKNTEKAPKKTIDVSDKMIKAGDNVTKIPTIPLPGTDTTEETGSGTEKESMEGSEDESEHDIFDLDEPDDLPKEEKKRSGRLKILCHKVWENIKKIWTFVINHTPGKVAERVTGKIEKKTATAKKKIRRLQNFWNLSCTVKTREYLKKYIPRTLKHILPRKVKGYVHYGMDEPYKTGQVTGYLSLLPFVYQKGLSMQPDFEKKVLEMDVKLKGRIQLGYLLRIVLNRNIWRTIKTAKKVMNQ